MSPTTGTPLTYATSVALAQRVTDTTSGPARLLLCPAPVRDVVSFRGSFWTGIDLSTDDDLAQGLAVDLLDKGTRGRDRFEIAEALEGRGAQLHFYADNLRVGFAGRALKEDLADVLQLLAEQLREPALDADEFEKERRQAVAAVRRAKDSTAGRATGALTRRLYGPSHPNVVPEPDVELARLQALTPERIRAFHAAHFGPDRLTLAFAGDLNPPQIEAGVQAHFGDWAPTGAVARFDPEASPEAPGRSEVSIADRPNLDVRLGHPVALRRDDPAFVAAHAGVFALGGNFSSRLMQTVRDEMGLTYGIGAGLHNVAVEHVGHFLLYASLSTDRLEEGLRAARAVVEQFVEEGVGEAELAQVKTTLTGQNAVGMATTSGLATRLLVNAERGFGVSYLDGYADRINGLTVEAVNRAIRLHVRPADLHTAVAGTLPQ